MTLGTVASSTASYAAARWAEIFLEGPLGAVGFLFLWLVIGNAFLVMLLRFLKVRSRLTHTNLDEMVVESLDWPILVTWTLLGVYLYLGGFRPVPEVWQTRITFILMLAFAVIAAHTAVRLSVVLLENRAKRHPSFRALEGILEFLLRLGFYSVAFLVVLDHAGVQITPLLGALGIGGLAVALALQDTLSNFFAGLYLTIDRPLREGDFLEIDGGTFGTIRGYVVDIGWRSVRIRELGNNIFVLPNSRLASGIIKNYDLPEGEMSVLVQCAVAYGSDLPEVERVTVDVAREMQHQIEGAVPTHDPFVRFHTFGDNGIQFTVILRTRTFVDQYLMTHEFVKALHTRFAAEGIVVPFPQRTLHFRDDGALPPVRVQDQRATPE